MIIVLTRLPCKAQQLANHLKAPCYALSELKAENLYHPVKDEMAKPMKK
ncbi:MAG: hypothetical protein U0V48_08905 [Anaerolineales bacterium]